MVARMYKTNALFLFHGNLGSESVVLKIKNEKRNGNGFLVQGKNN